MREPVRDQAQSLREIVAQKRAEGIKPEIGSDAPASVLDNPEPTSEISSAEESLDTVATDTVATDPAPPSTETDAASVEPEAEDASVDEEEAPQAETQAATPVEPQVETEPATENETPAEKEEIPLASDTVAEPEREAEPAQEAEPTEEIPDEDKVSIADESTVEEEVTAELDTADADRGDADRGDADRVETGRVETDMVEMVVEPEQLTSEESITDPVAVEVKAPAVVPAEIPTGVEDKKEDKVAILPVRPRNVRLPLTRSTRVLAVTSGKGGVGKTNVTCNVALAMSRMGKKVVVFDADLSLANVDILLGLSPRYNLSHVLSGEKSMKEILVQAAPGFFVVPGVSGLEEFANLSMETVETLLDDFSALDNFADILMIDTAAGISHSVMSFLLAADQVVVVTTPEPTAYMDAYALIKVLVGHDRDKSLQMIVNMATNESEGREVFKVLTGMTRQWLHAGFDSLGVIPRDVDVLQSVRSNAPVLVHSPHSVAAKRLRHIAAALLQGKQDHSQKTGIRGFMKRVLTHLRKAV